MYVRMLVAMYVAICTYAFALSVMCEQNMESVLHL